MTSDTRRGTTGSLVVLVLFALATIVMAIDMVVQPQRRYVSLLFFAMGLLGTWRQYRTWRGAR